jgi:hypothetical protein
MGTEQQPPDPRPIAFIYDRHAAPTKTALEARIEAARDYAVAQGWPIGGYWLDVGDDALGDHDRPALRALCNTMRAHGSLPMVCLIYDWDRLARDPEARTRLRNRIALAGGWTATVGGQNDREPLQPGTIAALYRASL